MTKQEWLRLLMIWKLWFLERVLLGKLKMRHTHMTALLSFFTQTT